ncbi:MAG: ABC transporter ATP-binding protein [Thermodesulfovibrionia bacterium]|nr:ABC transporter ATP-binding protein [Thermodesulfovibrionia bacterium]
MIKTENVTKIFNPGMSDEVKAITDVSIEIKRGEVVVLKGPSGSGKTTLLSLIGCITRPTEGRVIVNGKNVAKLQERFLTGIRQKTFGFVFQQFNLIRSISVIENIMLPLYPTNIKLSAIKKRAESIMEKLGISNKKDFKVQRLSGGEQQRAAIARSLINEPEIILADEPTAHLDTNLSEEIMRIFQRLNEDGKTIVIATHDPFIYERQFIQRTIEMRDGVVKNILNKNHDV